MLRQGRDKFRFAPSGEIAFYVGTTETANGGSLVYIPSRSKHLIFIRRDLRPVELEPLTAPMIPPVSTYIINEGERPTLVLPENSRLTSPGMTFIENQTSRVIDDILQEEQALVYESIVTTPQGQQLLATNPHLSHVHDSQVENIVSTSTQTLPTTTSIVNQNIIVPMEVLSDSEGGQHAGVAETQPMESDHIQDKNLRLPVRTRRPPSRFSIARVSLVGDVALVTELPCKESKVSTLKDDNNPTLGQAINAMQWAFRWLPAIDTEFGTLDKMGTWVDVAVQDIPNDALVYPTKIALTSKLDAVTGVSGSKI
jgi:hypothetical protein